MPRIWQRGSRLAVTKSPKNIPNTIKLKSKFGNEIIYQRQGSGRLATLVPLFILRKQTPEPQRVHLVNTATEMINKMRGAGHGGHGAAGDRREPLIHRYFRGLFTAGSPRPRPLVTDSPKILISLRLEAP